MGEGGGENGMGLYTTRLQPTGPLGCTPYRQVHHMPAPPALVLGEEGQCSTVWGTKHEGLLSAVVGCVWLLVYGTPGGVCFGYSQESLWLARCHL